MRYIAAYLLLQIGGNASPSEADIKTVLEAAGCVHDASLQDCQAEERTTADWRRGTDVPGKRGELLLIRSTAISPQSLCSATLRPPHLYLPGKLVHPQKTDANLYEPPITASTLSRSASPSSSPSSRARTSTSSSRRVPPSSPLSRPADPAVVLPPPLLLAVLPRLPRRRLRRRRRRRRRVRRLLSHGVALPPRRIKLTGRFSSLPQSPTTTWASDSSTKRFAPQRLSYLVAHQPKTRSPGKPVAGRCSSRSVVGAASPHRVPSAGQTEETVRVLRHCSASSDNAPDSLPCESPLHRPGGS